MHIHPGMFRKGNHENKNMWTGVIEIVQNAALYSKKKLDLVELFDKGYADAKENRDGLLDAIFLTK